jgi:hypothetical protein
VTRTGNITENKKSGHSHINSKVSTGCGIHARDRHASTYCTAKPKSLLTHLEPFRAITEKERSGGNYPDSRASLCAFMKRFDR